MDDAAFKALIERQAKEQSALEKLLDDTRAERAAELTRQELKRPTPPGLYPPGMVPAKVDEKVVQAKNLHNLGIQDRQELARSQQRHEAELVQSRAQPTLDFNKKAELKRFRDDALKRFQINQGQGLGRGLRRGASTGNDK